MENQEVTQAKQNAHPNQNSAKKIHVVINEHAQAVIADELKNLLPKFHVLSAAEFQLGENNERAACAFLQKHGYENLVPLEHKELRSTITNLVLVYSQMISIAQSCLSSKEYMKLNNQALHDWYAQQLIIEDELKKNKTNA